jgi:hypothetical protein
MYRKLIHACMLFSLIGCTAPPLQTPAPSECDVIPFVIQESLKTRVDLLFMVDNSNSMEPMQVELLQRFDELLQFFRDLANSGTFVDLHLGVITSDYGAGDVGAPGCQPSPGGQQGRLQALGQEYQHFDATCRPPMGANFIQYTFAASGTPASNLPPGQDLLKTLQCMASVGDNGCGFEHQLESSYAALHNNLPENAGFLRDDAILAVVYLTNEDDSSAAPDVHFFDRSHTEYGYEDSFRQTRYGVLCGNPPAMIPYGPSMGDLSPCIAAPNPGNSIPDREYDIGRYVDFFTRPADQGGVKQDPLDVVLVAIDAPETPFIVGLANPGTPSGSPYVDCSPLNDNASPACSPVLQHSCVNPNDHNFFGDPAVRLNSVVRAAPNHGISSICADSYAGALQDLGRQIVGRIGLGCVPGKLPDPSHPDCAVEDVSHHAGAADTRVEIPACSDGGAFPCWRVEPKSECATLSPDGVGVTIDRNGQPAPPDTEARVSCAIAASATASCAN